jgi:putative ABC transport system permease protein
VAGFLAVRSVLRSNYGVAVLTTLMLTLIFLDLLFLPSLIQGAVNRVNSQIVNTLTSDIAITPAGARTAITDTSAYLSQIRRTGGVAGATAVLRVGTQVSYGSFSGVWEVDAIDPTSYEAVFTTPDNTVEGKYLSASSDGEALLGIGIAGADQTKVRGYRASLQHVHAGDTVQITLRNGQVEPFRVAGIYDDQFPLSDKNAYITQREAQALLPGSANRATTIFVRTIRGADVNQVVTRLAKLRGNVNFETSAALSGAVQDQIATFNLIDRILKVVSLLFAAIVIFIITYVDLVNKRRQIGIQRAIGIKSGAIVASYVIKAWAYAIVGIVAGLVLFRLAITPLVNAHPFHFPNGPVVLATNAHEVRQDVLILLIVALLAAALPAIQAVRLRIIDAIWGV